MAEITLRVLDGTDRGRVYENLHTPVSIGREEGNSIQLNDERVSRFHLKIQEDRDKVVLTDLESTNGTKVNGDDVQLRILRFGDVISVGRTVLLYGSREQIALRLAEIRGLDPDATGTMSHKDLSHVLKEVDLDFDLNWTEDSDVQRALHNIVPPDLPERLSPGQAAQLSELLQYLHIRIRDLVATINVKPQTDHVVLDADRWQQLLDLQSRLAGYLRSIGEPEGDGS